MEKKIFLAKGWKLKGENVEGMDIAVPGDVTATLYENGIIDDPLFGQNSKNCTWIAENDWTYSCKFDVDQNVFDFKRIKLSYPIGQRCMLTDFLCLLSA